MSFLLLGEPGYPGGNARGCERSEEQTSEIQPLMRTSYAGFCLKKKKKRKNAEITQISMKTVLNNMRTTLHKKARLKVVTPHTDSQLHTRTRSYYSIKCKDYPYSIQH